MLDLTIASYPTLDARVFVTEFPTPLGLIQPIANYEALLSIQAEAPVSRSEELRGAVRDLLRHKGYKPTGRGKPASEYLVKAGEKGTLRTINAAVDACNIVSLHSGFPISVIDLDRATAPLSIKPAAENERYIFNASGQEINVTGLLCLHDAEGPCANPVKDSQRTKTSDETVRTLNIVWGLDTYKKQLDAASAWYMALLVEIDAFVESISPITP